MKTRKFKKIIMSIVFSFSLLWSSFIMPIHAEETEGKANFSIQAIIPENQIDKANTYFDLMMKENDKQVIQVEVLNTGNKPIIADVSINRATSADNGGIVYSKHGISDDSLFANIEDIAVVETPQVEVAANSSTLVNITLTMPEKAYDGVILGSIFVSASAKDEQETQSKAKEGVAIENKISYALGLKLSESTKEITPNLELKGVKPSIENLKASVVATVQNDQAIIMKGAKVNGVIYKGKSKEAYRTLQLDNVNIAPNSSLNFVYDWNDEQLQPGTYRMKMRIDYMDKHWEWDQEFEVKSKDSNNINEKSISEKKTTPWLLYSGIAIAVLLVLILVFMLGRRSKKDN